MYKEKKYCVLLILLSIYFYGCATQSVEIQLPSENDILIKYYKPQTATKKYEGSRADYEFYIDETLWKNFVPPSNENLDYDFRDKYEERFIYITGSRQPKRLETAVSDFFMRSTLPKPQYQDYRLVNDIKVYCSQINGFKAEGYSINMLIYVYCGDDGAVIVMGAARSYQWNEHKNTIMDGMNGLVMKKVQQQ